MCSESASRARLYSDRGLQIVLRGSYACFSGCYASRLGTSRKPKQHSRLDRQEH